MLNGRRSSVAHIVSLALGLSLPGCSGGGGELPTRGSAKIIVSDEVLPALRESESLFESLYPDAEVELLPASDREAIVEFFADSAKVVVVTRELNAEERTARTAVIPEMDEYTIAYDAVAVIVNSENPTTELSLAGLDSILLGSVRDWGLVTPERWVGGRLTIGVVVPDRNSATGELVESRTGGRFAPGTTRASSSEQVIDEVMRNPSAIGAVAMNVLRARQDSVRVLGLMDPSLPESLGVAGKHFTPHQAWIHKGYYTLVKKVKLYYTPDSYGVSSGFISFLTGAEGQKVMLKQGLVPATMPVRIVELKKDGVDWTPSKPAETEPTRGEQTRGL